MNKTQIKIWEKFHKKQVLSRKNLRPWRTKTNPKDLKAYENEKSLRSFRSVDEMPKYIQNKIEKILDYLIDTRAIEDLWLVSSYANGAYIDEFTNPSFIELKRKIKGLAKAKVSDFDVYSKSFNKNEIIELDDLKLHLINRKIFTQESSDSKILIYKR